MSDSEKSGSELSEESDEDDTTPPKKTAARKSPRSAKVGNNIELSYMVYFCTTKIKIGLQC